MFARSRFALTLVFGLSVLVAPASANAHVESMMTAEYTRAVSTLPVPVVISRYKSCEDATQEIVDDNYAKIAAHTKTNPAKWNQKSKCKLHYSGKRFPQSTIQKDQLEWMCGCYAQVMQYSQTYDSNDMILKIMTSKPGYFSQLTPPRLNEKQVLDYYTQGHGAAVAFPDGSIHYKGPYNLFVVDTNHLVCAYGVFWTAGYVVGSRDFTVVPDDQFVKGARCGDKSEVIYPKRPNSR